MDADGPRTTTGKPDAGRFVQHAQEPSWLDSVMARWRTWLVVLIVALVGIYYFSGRSSTTDSSSSAPAPGAHQIIPVAAVAAKSGDLKQYISAIGTVTAYNTVTVKSRVDGQLDKVNFTEGQMVKAGDELAEIDPRPYQVQLTQAEGTLAKDLATLENNKILLVRDKQLYDQKVIARQDLDNQQALVGQYAGSIESDKGAVDNAKLQLTYSRITSPITGRVGLRLVDPGNIIHATDATGLAVITQLQPIAVDFSIPEDDLPTLETAMKADPHLPVAGLRSRLQAPTGRGTTAHNRQSDRSDHRHDQAQGVLSQRGQLAVPESIRQREAAGQHHPERDAYPGGRAPAQSAGLIRLCRQAR